MEKLILLLAVINCMVIANHAYNQVEDTVQILSWNRVKQPYHVKSMHHRVKRGWGWCWTFWDCDDPPPPDTTPPAMSNCPDVQSMFHAEQHQTSVTVTWTTPTATDASGIKSGFPRKEAPAGKNSGDRFGHGSYTIRYIAQDNKGNTASCPDDVFQVVVTKCSTPTQPSNGRVSCPRVSPLYGETCTLSCNTGYTLNDESLQTQACSSNQNANGVGYYLPGYSNVRCIAKECDAPVIPDNVEAVQCTHGHSYGSSCSYECKSGYWPQEGSVKSRTCQADQTWTAELLACEDITPPVLYNCPADMTVYVGSDQIHAYVDYTPPTAVDNLGNTISVIRTHGLPPGEYVAINRESYDNNSYLVWYTATDSNNITATVPCTFTILVQELVCPFLDYQPRLIENCTEPYVYGATCTFECDYGYPLIGLSEVHCERMDGDPPSAYWNWGAWGNATYCGIVECPDLQAPLNGAMACVPISTGTHCTMSCNSAWDIPRTTDFTFTGQFVCDDAAGWILGTEVPDCNSQFRASSQRLPSEFYYSGDCSNETVRMEIQQSVIDRLNTSAFSARCTRHPQCTAENVEVTCGPTGRKKRTTALIRVQFDFVVVIVYQDGESIDDLDIGITNQMYAMYDEVGAEITSGHFDITGFTVDSNSYAEAGPTLDCEPGKISRYSTYSCVGCASGTYYSVDTDSCLSCPVGTYQEHDSQFNCTECNPGYSTKNTGSRWESNCTKLCDAGLVSIDGFVPCAPCPLNTYQTDIGQMSCTPCPNGGNTTTEGSDTILNCMLQDDHDVCQNDTCNGYGLCIPEIDSYRCICVSGYSGDTCNIPPDPCELNLCKQGSTCIQAGTNYTCNCAVGQTGEFCDLTIVDGEWGDYGDWSQCSVTCGEGTRDRIRLCNNPHPENGGLDCVGNDVLSESCTMDACPVCPQLKRPYGVILQCGDIGPDEQQCNLTCADQSLLRGYYPLSLNCGPNTGYMWNPEKLTDELPKCVLGNVADRLELAASYAVEVDDTVTEADANLLKAPAADIVNSASCVSSGDCQSDIRAEIQARKRRNAVQSPERQSRSTTPTVIIYITVSTNNGAAANVDVFEYIAESIYNASLTGGLDVSINNIVYTVDSSSFTITGDMTCPAGMTPLGNMCANCPPGTFAENYECQLCEVGYYQDMEGQTSCTGCSSGYTTTGVGSNSNDDCVVSALTTDRNIEMSTTSTVTTTTSGPQSGNENLIGVGVGAAVGVIVLLVIVIVILIILKCFPNNRPRRILSSASITPWEDYTRSRPVTAEKILLSENTQVSAAPLATVMPVLPYKGKLPPIQNNFDKPPPYSAF